MDGAPENPDEWAQTERERFSGRFEVGALLYSTRTSECFRAVDQSSGQPVFLWVLRYPLKHDSEAASRFLSRLENIASAETSIPSFLSFGVEPTGAAYLAMEPVRGDRLTAHKWETREAEQLFLEAARIVADLHVLRVLLGDITEDSFVISADNEGQLLLVAVMGAFEAEARKTASLPSKNTLMFVSPEQRSGVASELRSDVYALGVLGYRLFTGRYPAPEGAVPSGPDPIEGAPAPSTVVSSLPPWVDVILAKCLEIDPKDRFQDASQLYMALDGAIERGILPETGPDFRWAQKTVAVRASTKAVLTGSRDVTVKGKGDVSRSTTGKNEVKETEKAESPAKHGRRQEKAEKSATEAAAAAAAAAAEPAGQRSFLGLLLMMIAVIGLVAVAALFSTRMMAPSPGQQVRSDVAQLLDRAPSELKPAVSDLLAPAVSREQKKRQLLKLAKSDDPGSFELLLSTVGLVSDDEIRTLGRKSLLMRIDQSGLAESARLLEEVFNAAEKQGVDPARAPNFRDLMEAADRSRGVAERQETLRRLSAKNKDLALQLGASLAMDTITTGEFSPSLRELLKTAGVKAELEDKGVGPLILMHRGLSLTFEGRLVALLPQFSGPDLEEALRVLSDSDSVILQEVAREVTKRNIVAPFQQVFLRALISADKFRTPHRVRKALAQAARGVITREEFEAFAQWDDLDLARVLLAVCALAQDPRVATAALETLATRQLGEQPAQSLLDWVRVSVWDYRDKVAKAIGILGLIDVAKPEEIEFAFDQLMPYTAKGSLLKAMLASGDPRLISRTVDRTGEIVSSPDLLTLLSAKNDKQVRMAAIRALKGRNALDVLHAMLRAYEREEDEEVKQLYRDTHWVIRNRGVQGEGTLPVEKPE